MTLESESENGKRPEWAPEGAGDEFASRVKTGGRSGHDGFSSPQSRAAKSPSGIKRKKLTVDDYVNGVLGSDRMIIGRAITLVESNAPAHQAEAQKMLKRLLPKTGEALRVGISGLPGAGKSTFIETMGNYLCDQGHKTAVLAVDPSSTVTRGSILGDKTRMETLARRPEAFIRPSPSGGVLGGVARKSRETMMVLEAAGYDVLLVETVGVGQSEATVRSMVDFFLLVMITGAGDELQGIKRGIMELIDAVLINKADGDNKIRAEAARMEFERVLPYLAPATPGWRTPAMTCSSINGQGIPELWAMIEHFKEFVIESGALPARRRTQAVEWMRSLVEEHLEREFWETPSVKNMLPEVEDSVAKGRFSPTMAAERLLKVYNKTRGHGK